MTSIRRLTALILTIALIVVSAGTVAYAQSARTDMIYPLYNAPSSLDPQNAITATESVLFHQFYDTLIIKEDDGSYTPCLATEWSADATATVWTFKIREGVTFHNGDTLTAADVVYTLNRCAKSIAQVTLGSLLSTVEALDANTVVVTLVGPTNYILDTISNLGIVNAAYTESVKDENGYLGILENGTGAYMLDTYQEAVSYTLKAYDASWHGAPAIKTVTCLVIADVAAGERALESGDIDVASISQTDWTSITSAGNYGTFNEQGSRIYFICMNQDNPVFKDVLVRQAINEALNKADIALIAAESLATPADYMSNSLISGHSNDVSVYSYNPEDAKAKLTAAGYPDGVDLGELLSMAGDPVMAAAATTIQSQLAEVGIKVSIVEQDPNTLIGNAVAGNYSMCMMAIMLGYDYYMYSYIYNSMYLNAFDLSRYVNADVDAWFAKASALGDLEAVYAIYKDIQQKVQDDAVYAPIFFPNVCVAWNSGLNVNFRVQSAGIFFYECSWK
jgi:peptide/nickel transport system substrate-binding protein